MNIFTIVGIMLGVCVIFFDRYLVKISNWLAIVLYIVAVILIIVGMISSRNRSV